MQFLKSLHVPGLINPLILIYERLGMLRPTLVATKVIRQEWLHDEDSDTGDTFVEDITFYMLEYPSGRRSYDVFEYGRCEDTLWHETYLAEVLTWVHGGPLPVGSERPREPAQVTSLRVVATSRKP